MDENTKQIVDKFINLLEAKDKKIAELEAIIKENEEDFDKIYGD